MNALIQREATVARPAADPNQDDWRENFLDLLPEIEHRLRLAFRRLNADARQEAVQEATCSACRAYARLAAAGRSGCASASTLAHYAAAQYRAGRRVSGPLNADDVCSDYCRLRRGLQVERLDSPAAESWEEILVEDRTVTPAELAASRIDYSAFLATLPNRDRQVAEALATGETTGSVAHLLGLSAGRVSQLRRELHAAWLRFHGEEFLDGLAVLT